MIHEIQSWMQDRRQRKERQRYRRAMSKAIDTCVHGSALFNVKGVGTTDALRCIRTFERVNGISFDPFNERHVDHIRGMATHENFFRRARKLFEKKKQP